MDMGRFLTCGIGMAESQIHPRPRFPSQFFGALTRPSAAGLLGTLLVAMLWFACCACFLTRHLLAHHPQYLAGSGFMDESTFITADVLRICEGPPEELGVTIIGNSAVRDAITDEADLSERLSRKAGRNVNVHILAAPRLDLWNMVCVGDAICGHTHGLAVLQISPYDLATNPRTIRKPLLLALDSPALDAELQIHHYRPRPHCDNYFFSQYQFFAAREEAIANLWQPPAPRELHQMRIKGSREPLQGSELAAILDAQLNGYGTCAEQNMQVYQRAIKHLKDDGGIGVVLLEMPTNPRTMESMFHDPQRPRQRELYENYLLDRQRLSRQAGIPILDLAEEAGLEAGDFKDYTHLNGQEGHSQTDARERYAQTLAGHLAALLAAAVPSAKPEPKP